MENMKKENYTNNFSIIHDADLIDTQKIYRKTSREIQKPKCVLDYNKYEKKSGSINISVIILTTKKI